MEEDKRTLAQRVYNFCSDNYYSDGENVCDTFDHLDPEEIQKLIELDVRAMMNFMRHNKELIGDTL